MKGRAAVSASAPLAEDTPYRAADFDPDQIITVIQAQGRLMQRTRHLLRKGRIRRCHRKGRRLSARHFLGKRRARQGGARHGVAQHLAQRPVEDVGRGVVATDVVAAFAVDRRRDLGAQIGRASCRERV